jgi:hypothetical protein
MYTVAYYRTKAAQFRELASNSDKQTAATLMQLADDFEAEAERLEASLEPPMPPAS